MRGASITWRVLSLLSVLSVLSGLFVLGGCASFAEDDGGGDPALVDGGLDSGARPADAGLSDGSWNIDAGTSDAMAPPPGSPEAPLLARSEGDEEFSAAGRAECYETACAAPGCGAVRSCCVGAGTCCAPVAASPLPTLDSSACDDGAAEACFTGVVPFGDPTPTIFSGTISPGGDGAGDSGLLTTETVDLTAHRLSVTARFRPGDDCDAGCFETAGVGITSQSMVTGELRTLAALQYSAAQNRLLLMVRDVVVGSLDAPAETTDYVLDLQPTGEVAVHEGPGGPARITARYRPVVDARVAIFGHGINPSGGTSPTTIDIRGMTLELCDVPAGWRDRQQVLIGGTPVLSRSASLAAGPDRALAYEDDGGISLALGTPSGHEFTAVIPGAPVVDATAVTSLVTGAATFSDPELVRHGDGWRLFFTLRDAGVASIAARDFSLDFQTAQPVAMAIAARTVTLEGANDATIEVAEPTVVEHESGVTVLVVRARSEGETWFELYRADDPSPDSFYRIEAPILGSLSGRGAAPASGFSRDEVGHPALSIHNGAWHLHFAARRGTRSSIGLLVSDDLIHWRNATGAAVLDSGAAPWEALGVSVPDAVANGDAFEMVYAGLDGVRSTLAWATRPGTDAGGFL